MTPIRAKVKQLVDEGNTWVFIAMFTVLSLVIAVQTVVRHYDARNMASSIESLTVVMEANTALVQKSIEQSQKNYEAIQSIRP